MRPFIVIDLPIDPQARIGMSPKKCVATFYLTPPFVLSDYKRDNMSLLVVDGETWHIALPLKELKEKIAEASE